MQLHKKYKIQAMTWANTTDNLVSLSQVSLWSCIPISKHLSQKESWWTCFMFVFSFFLHPIYEVKVLWLSQLVMWLLCLCKQVYLYTDERLYCIKVQTVQTVQMWQPNKNSRKLCCTVFLYSKVQTVHRIQILELHITEHLYACVAVHKEKQVLPPGWANAPTERGEGSYPL